MALDVANLLSVDGPVARRLEGFEPRPQQLEMAAAVETALEQRGRLLVEAGTGVGKSFAYLVPAIKRIVDHSERVVVVTHTINLQEQLIEKDIPLLNAVIPDEFSAVLVKGRGNYVSLRRLKLASERQEKLLPDDDLRHGLHQIEDWAYSTRDGTLATLPQPPRPQVWDLVQSESNNCMGRKCPTYKQCFYQAARRRMENGDLLVCNHALFFSDLALRVRGVGFLPPYDHVILDEAHSVEDVASEHFGLSLGEARIAHLLRLLYQPRTGRGFLATLRLKDGATEPIDRAIEQALRCRDAADAMFSSLAHWQAANGSENGRIREAGIVADLLSPEMKTLAEMLKFLKERAASEADEFELNSYAVRSAAISDESSMLLGQHIDGCVYWLEGGARSPRPSRRGGDRPARLSLNCMPIDIAPIMRERLFGPDVSVIMTSATLAIGGGDFAHIKSRLGCDDAATMQLGSPFDLARQVHVFVDRSMPEPRAPDHLARVCPKIIEHVRATDGGAFVLFTSFAMLELVAERLREELAELDLPMLVHGRDGPPGLLLKRFRQNERSVLLGTNSFWQGVDVRGRGLRNVIIVQLPFDVPDRPLIQARHERIEQRGGKPFVEDQVPRAVLRFRQGFGRLIRSATDSGRIVVLDPRIATKFYGRAFLAAIPEGVRIEDECRHHE
jgi:ATP-dependent DNA helicase DinG